MIKNNMGAFIDLRKGNHSQLIVPHRSYSSIANDDKEEYVKSSIRDNKAMAQVAA